MPFGLDYDQIITLASSEISIALIISVVLMLARREKEARDYAAILFVVAVCLFFVLIALRRIFDWPPWAILSYFGVMLVAANGLLYWIVRGIRRGI